MMLSLVYNQCIKVSADLLKFTDRCKIITPAAAGDKMWIFIRRFTAQTLAVALGSNTTLEENQDCMKMLDLETTEGSDCENYDKQ